MGVAFLRLNNSHARGEITVSNQNGTEKLSAQFKALTGNQGLTIQFYDKLPTPIQIFAPDGTCIFINQAYKTDITHDMEGNVVEHYNLRTDENCLAILGQEIIDQIFRGEKSFFADFPAPISDTFDKGYIDKKPWTAATMDISAMPLWDGDVFVCTVCFFTLKQVFPGRVETQKAQEYIEGHWRDELDLEEVARYAGMSSRHLRRIFIEDAGITPVEFYQRIKIEKLKEKLFDGNLSIEQAFKACGVDIHGAYFKLFKETEGMTPAEYRKANNI